MTYRENITEILNWYFPGFKEEIIDSACDRILSIDQEPRFIAKSDGTIEQIKIQEKGYWIPYLKEGLIVKCSECGSRFSLGYNFCPNCGADMREVEE